MVDLRHGVIVIRDDRDGFVLPPLVIRVPAH